MTKTKWETHLSAEDHADAEERRKILGLTRAAYTRAALCHDALIDAESMARTVGLVGQVLFDLVETRRSYPDLGVAIDPMIETLQEAVLLGGRDAP